MWVKRKIDFLLLESSNTLGGVIRTQTHKHFVLENGPNTVLNNNSSIQKLVNDCELKDKMIFPEISSNSKRYVFHNNNPVAVPLPTAPTNCGSITTVAARRPLPATNVKRT